MKQYLAILECKKEGKIVEAMEMEDELLLRIEMSDSVPPISPTGSVDADQRAA